MASYRTLLAYEKAFNLSLRIHEISKSFPKEENWGLTSQIRRSSRSVCVNTAEAYKRRRYKSHYLSKLNDAETENCETQVWIDFAYQFKYINKEDYDSLTKENDEIGKFIWYMITHPEKYIE